MDTLTPALTCQHTWIRLSTTAPTTFADLTGHLDRIVSASGVHTGWLNVQTRHTTTGLVVNEHEPRLLEDFGALFERLVPRGQGYRHDDLAERPDVPADEPVNGHAHCRALLLSSAVCLNVVDGRLALGEWQRVFLVELDGPRHRTLSVVLMGAPR